MEALGFTLKQEANLHTLIEDVLKTSEIEGEILDQEQVRSSLARRLGLDMAGLKPTDREPGRDGLARMVPGDLESSHKHSTQDSGIGSKKGSLLEYDKKH
jgi:hypothetical protein